MEERRIFLALIWISLKLACVYGKNFGATGFENCSDSNQEGCGKACSPNCRSSCDANRLCHGGCVEGWTGTMCTQPCQEFQYGMNCQKTCGHCIDDAVCDVITGQCPGKCEPGFHGPLCNEGCDPYFYGDSCINTCHHCRNDKPCNMVSGSCINGCALGWTGDKCDKVCANMTYGMDCSGNCGNCADGVPCNHVTGECPYGCAPGWTGPHCNQPCSVGWYGGECDFHCGYCKTSTCDMVTGICSDGCMAGWMGPQCRTACSPGRYGEDCNKECGHCEDDVCDRSTGICALGCQPGWQGIECHQPCEDDYYGKSCAMRCGHCTDDTPCNSSTGVCDSGCNPGWDGRYCTQRTPAGGHSVAVTPTADGGSKKKQPTVSLLVAVIALLFIALSSTMVYFIFVRPRRQDLATRLHRLSSIRSNQDLEPHIYEQVNTGPWEITKTNLILTTEKLGHGQFGQVRKGYIKNVHSHNIPVAVKSLKVSASEKDKTDFMNELLILKKVGHHVNVVCLAGSCHIAGTLYVAMEYCEHGDLRTHLRNSRRKKQKIYSNVQAFAPMSHSTLLQFALNVACGMAHLAERQIIHRDLAARNVLLDDNFVAKVADFGLSKNDDTYVKTSKTKVPVRWLALESIYNDTYTAHSDVWSFGVLLWEIVTFGGTPYHGMNTQQFCDLLKQGYRLCRPRHCDLKLYAMMLQCWQEEPLARPDFNDLQARLQAMLDDTQIYINIDEELGYLNMDGTV